MNTATNEINENEAPAGFRAVAAQPGRVPCKGCEFHSIEAGYTGCSKASNVSCMAYRRADEQTVIFVRARS